MLKSLLVVNETNWRHFREARISHLQLSFPWPQQPAPPKKKKTNNAHLSRLTSFFGVTRLSRDRAADNAAFLSAGESGVFLEGCVSALLVFLGATSRDLLSAAVLAENGRESGRLGVEGDAEALCWEAKWLNIINILCCSLLQT